MRAFLQKNREDLVRRWLDRLRASLPGERTMSDIELIDSFNLYFDELIEALSTGTKTALAAGKSGIARMHGSQRHALKRSVEDVVHEYGLFFECVVEASVQQKQLLGPEDLSSLSRLLFTGCAEAASEYGRQRDEELQRAQFEHFAFVAHELRNPLNSVSIAWSLIRDGSPAANRSRQVLERNLERVRSLIDHSLVEVRLRSVGVGASLRRERALLATVLDDLRTETEADAVAKDIQITVECDAAVAVQVDLRLFRSALSNLIRNGIKFSLPGSRVIVTGRVEQGRAIVDVEDRCGGLPPEKAEKLFDAFTQAGDDRSGFGLGLAIARGAVEAHGGAISVKNVPARGCIFTVDVEAVA